METSVPYLPEEGSLNDEFADQQYEIRSAEEAFRRLLSRLAVAACFLVSSLIVYYLLPFYPPKMAVFLALIPAAIALRWPAVALFFMLAVAAPAYSYQLGVTIWALGIMIAIAVFLPFGLSGLPGASVGCALGAAAGVLMVTPYFYLALPLLAGSTVLRFRGSTVGGGWALFMFLSFFLPFLSIANLPTVHGETIPLFQTVDYTEQPVLSNLNLSTLKAAFDNQINNSFSGFAHFSEYFYRGFGGVALILTMLMSVMVTPALVNTARHLRVGSTAIRALSPLILLLAVELVFLVPLRLLADPLGYSTGFATWDNVGILTGTMAALGISAGLIEVWLHRRNLKVEHKSDLSILALELYELLDSAGQRLRQVAAVCHNSDLSTEKALISQYEEKVALTLESMSISGLTRLELSHEDFYDMQSDLPVIEKDLSRKLFDHLDESKRAYKAITEQALVLGIPAIEDIIQAPPTISAHHDYSQALLEQQKLNSAFQNLAAKLVSTGDMVASTINEEIDPEFSLTTIDISHGFLDQGRYEDAARTITEDLQIIDGRIEGSIIELANSVISMTKRFIEVLTGRLTPVFESIGDLDSLSRYKNTATELDSIADLVHDSRTLADIITIVEQSRRLSNLATNTVKELRRTINSIEADNDRRSPAKYSWGRNSHATSEIQQLLSTIDQPATERTISSRFDIIDKALHAIEQQSKTLKQYSQVNEFLINYWNIEYIVLDKLSTSAVVASSELPVKPKYAIEYLKMYAAANSSVVAFDSRSGSLKYISGNGTNED